MARDWASGPFAKSWHEEFLKDRQIKDQRSYVDRKREECSNFENAPRSDGKKLRRTGTNNKQDIENRYKARERRSSEDDDTIAFFLNDDSWPSCQVQAISNFCRIPGGSLLHLRNLLMADGVTKSSALIWLDDRSRCGCARRSGGIISDPYKLYQLLKAPRFGHKTEPDGDRRLIFIQNLNPLHVLAIAETAVLHQRKALIEMLFDHITYETALRVRIPSRGYTIFELALHLPYFVVRSKKGTSSQQNDGEWEDLSFLDGHNSGSGALTKHFMCQKRISLMICGTDESTWVAYAFVDSQVDESGVEEGLNDDEDDDDDEEDDDEEDEEEDAMEEDRILSATHHADVPIQNPREYFLTAIERRLVPVVKEWRHLVYMIEKSVTNNENRRPANLTTQPKSSRNLADDAKRDFDWTEKTRKLLGRFLELISVTVQAWDTFKEHGGDIDYFTDKSSSSRWTSILLLLKKKFETLDILRQKLILLDERCKRRAEALQLRLSLEGNQAIQEQIRMATQTNKALEEQLAILNENKAEAAQNRTATELTFTIIAPVALATAYFAMPPAVVPFHMSVSSFIFTVVGIAACLKLARVCSISGIKNRVCTITGLWNFTVALPLPVSEMRLGGGARANAPPRPISHPMDDLEFGDFPTSSIRRHNPTTTSQRVKSTGSAVSSVASIVTKPSPTVPARRAEVNFPSQPQPYANGTPVEGVRVAP